MSKRVLLKSSCIMLDDAMGGGLKEGDILQIFGPPGIGKTTIALQYAIDAARQKSRVLFIDADRTFSLVRLQQMTSMDFENISPLISVVSPDSFSEQEEVISQLRAICTGGIQLLIFDTIASLYRRELGNYGDNIILNRLLNRQLGMIAEVVKTSQLIAILVNQVRGDVEEPSGFCPVAHSIVSFWCTKSIQITKAESVGYREFKLTTRDASESKEFLLRLGSEGFQ